MKAEAKPIEIVAAGEVAKIADGSVSMVAYNGGKLRLGNFREPAIVDLSSVTIMGNADQQPLLLDHRSDQPVGHGRPIVHETHLEVQGELSVPGEHKEKVIKASQDGFEWQASIGGSIQDVRKDARRIAAGQAVKVNGRVHVGPAVVLSNFQWAETSFVALGADEDRATARVAASFPKREVLMNEFEKWLQACGINHEDLDDSQVTNLKATWEASQKKPEEPKKVEASSVVVPSADEAIKAMRTEQLRLSRIDRLVVTAGRGVDADKVEEIRAKAIDGEISEDRAHLLLLQASRAAIGDVSNTAGGSHHHDIDALTLEAAVCRTAGIPEEQIEKGFQRISASADSIDRAMNESASSRYDGAGIGALIYAACRQAGKSPTFSPRIQDEDIRTALEHSRSVHAASAISTVSVPGILSRVANKAMLVAYAEADNGGAILDVAVRESTSDFKKFDRYRMTESGTMEKISSTGRIPHGTVQEDSYENQVHTYGKMMNLSRQMQRNDDLGAFLQVPRMLGRMGRHSLEEIGFTLLANATKSNTAGTTEFFHGAARTDPAEGANFIQGASAAFGIDSLGSAYKLFLDQVDRSGKPIMIEPDRVLVTTTNYVAARKVYNDAEVRFTSADTRDTVGNEWQGMFRPYKSSYLGTVGTTPNPDQWYLLPNPASGIGLISVAFLDGRDTPIIEMGSVDFDQLGVSYRGYFDFGFALQDPRGGVMSFGKAN